MSEENSLQSLVAEADALGASTRKARHLAVTRIRREDWELATLLTDLLTNESEQADWFFSKLFRREERPIDLYLSGRASEVRNILGRLLHSTIL